MAGPSQIDSITWRWAAASAIGTGHAHAGGRLEDAYGVSVIGNHRLLAIVSDGAGSAEFGNYGAWLTCRMITLRFREWYAENSQLPSDGLLDEWIEELRGRISLIANQRDSSPRQFAATLASALITPDEILTIQIGDSAIVGRKENAWDVLCWPENGEYASTTYFVTDELGPRLNITRAPREHDAFALFSDGVGDLALSHSQQAAHPQFFDPMLRPVDDAHGHGRLPELSAMLKAYLASPAVCERTDDDKTLVLISGR